MGLAFKAGTNDVRTSLSVRVIHLLLNFGAAVVAHDPMAMGEAKEVLQGIDYAQDPYDAVAEADLVMVLTDWPAYREVDWGRVAATMRGKQIFDGRNAVDPDACTSAGLVYSSMGRGKLHSTRSS